MKISTKQFVVIVAVVILTLLFALIITSRADAQDEEPLANPRLLEFQEGALYIVWESPPWYANDSYAVVTMECLDEDNRFAVWTYGIPVTVAIGYNYYYEYWIPPNNSSYCTIISQFTYVYARPTQTQHYLSYDVPKVWSKYKLTLPVAFRNRQLP